MLRYLILCYNNICFVRPSCATDLEGPRQGANGQAVVGSENTTVRAKESTRA